MRPNVLQTATCLICLCAAIRADDRPPVADGAVEAEVLVYPVRNTPPDQIANALRSLYGDEAALRIATAPGGESLLLRVAPEIRDDVLRVLENVDPPASRLAIQVALVHQVSGAESAELDSLSGSAGDVWSTVRELEGRGQVRVSDRIQTTALQNQQTMVNVAQQRPVATGVSNDGRGNTAAIYREQTTGTLLTFRGRSAPDGQVVLELQFEKSEIVELPETPIRESVSASGTDTTVVRSTVSLPSGTATLLSAAGSDAGRPESYLILSATVLGQGEDRVASMFDRGDRPDRRAVEERVSRFDGRRPSQSDVLFERFDRNQDGVVRTDELTASLRLNAPPDGEWDRDAFREWLQENQSTARRESSFGAGRSRSFGSSSRGGFLRPPSGLLGTLMRDDVAEMLDLTEDQRTQAAELARNNRPTIDRDVFERMRNADEGERERITEELAEIRRQHEEETEQKLAGMLSPEGMARLKQLELQYSGYQGILRDDVATVLNLTDEQKSRIRELSIEAARRRFRGSAEGRARLEQQQNEAFFAELTDEQRQAWQEMVGEVVVDNGIPRN